MVGRILNFFFFFIMVLFDYIKFCFFYIYWNFKKNIERLLIYYDFFEIMKDILNLDFVEKFYIDSIVILRGISLF